MSLSSHLTYFSTLINRVLKYLVCLTKYSILNILTHEKPGQKSAQNAGNNSLTKRENAHENVLEGTFC